MKTTEVNKELIGRRCECIFTGIMVTGVIEDTEENEHTTGVKVRFDHPHQWGDELYNNVWAWGRKSDEFGTLHHLQLLVDKPDFQIMTVVFGKSISQIDRSIFEDADTWGGLLPARLGKQLRECPFCSHKRPYGNHHGGI